MNYPNYKVYIAHASYDLNPRAKADHVLIEQWSVSKDFSLYFYAGFEGES